MGAHGERVCVGKELRIPAKPNPIVSINCCQQQRGHDNVNRTIRKSDHTDNSTALLSGARPTDNVIQCWKDSTINSNDGQ